MGIWWPGGGSRPDRMRFAELYANAVERLGDRSATSRVGALHTLEALGQEFAQHRPAIVNVLCAYLRMPDDGDAPVRVAARRILTVHLRPSGPSFWPDMSIDLTGATLADLDLSGCRIDGDLILDGAALNGVTKLRRVIVGGTLSLRHAVAHDHIWLERSEFLGPVRADYATLHGDSWFGESTFSAGATFIGATFGGHAWFAGCTCRGAIDFSRALFRSSAGFRGATLPSVGLANTTFLGPARVSRRGDAWNVYAPGWTVVPDPDNESVGQLHWLGDSRLVDNVPLN
jgi:Pentapeptide repeats (9 copies)